MRYIGGILGKQGSQIKRGSLKVQLSDSCRQILADSGCSSVSVVAPIAVEGLQELRSSAFFWAQGKIWARRAAMKKGRAAKQCKMRMAQGCSVATLLNCADNSGAKCPV